MDQEVWIINTIKFGEIKINDEMRKHVIDCLDRDYVTMGPKTKELENLWRDKFGYKSVKAVGSGTAACTAACMALYDFGAEPGDQVIVPALSFIATANAVRAAGLTPVFCDIRLETMLIDESKIEGLINDKTRAIMPVSLMGKAPNMPVIRDIANKNNIMVILDNCEGHGCKSKGEYMSYWSDMVVYSCYAAHILFSGELGFVGCSTDDLGDIIESVRSHGRPRNSLYFSHERYGLNLKPTDLHASIGLGSFSDFDKIIEDRTKNFKYLRERLQCLNQWFWFTEEESHDTNSPHAFSLTLKPLSVSLGMSMSGLGEALDNSGVDWKRNFGAMPDHDCFKYLMDKGTCINATYVGNNGLHVGVHQYLTLEDLDVISDTIIRYVEEVF